MHELATLLRRDHRELDASLLDLTRPSSPIQELCDAIDGIRLGILAHDEAQDIVLSTILAELPDASPLHLVVARTRTEHLHTESAFSALVVTTPHTHAWRRHINHLRTLIDEHDRREVAELAPLIARELHPKVRDRLAGRFATERLCQLGTLEPSAPIAIPHEHKHETFAYAALQLA